MIYSTFLLLFFSFLLFNNTATGQNRNLNFRDLTPYSNSQSVKARLFHKADSSFIIIECSDNNAAISAKVYEQYDYNKMLLDTFVNNNNITKIDNQIHIFLPVNADKKLWAVELQINGNNLQYYDILLANRAQDNEQSIFILRNGNYHLQKYASVLDTFTLSERSATAKFFYLKYFPNTNTAANFVYITTKEYFNPLKGCSELITVSANQKFKFNKQGLYFIQTDTNSNKGTFIIAQDADYPKIAKLDDLIAPLQYIAKSEEYNTINKSSDRKAEVDKYWLARSKNKEQARAALKLYYQAIANANCYFTVHKSGWQTDRGMVFVVFGTPDIVRKSANQEIWFYKGNNLRQPTELVFNRVGELYTLERSRAYKDAWTTEINKWRKAKF